MPLAVADDLHNKQSKVKKQINAAKSDLDDSSALLNIASARVRAAQAKLSSAENALAKTQSALHAAQVVDAQLQAKLVQAQAALKAAEAAVVQAKQRVKDQRDDIGRLAAESYSTGDPSLMNLTVMLKSHDPASLTSQLNTVDNLMNKQDTLLDEFKATQARLVVEQAKVEDAKDAVAAQKAAAAENVKKRQALEAQAASARAEVAKLVSSRKSAEAHAEDVRAGDAATLRRLHAKDAEISRQIAARAARGSSGNFGNGGGALARPVNGPVTSPYGYRVHPIYGYYSLHDGTDFGAGCGQRLYAAGNGKVTSRYYSSVWGNRLYLDLGTVRGKRITVIYNHLSGYNVGVGQRVSRGQTVGYVGTTGWSTGCHLHFTVMQNGAPVNPMNWF